MARRRPGQRRTGFHIEKITACFDTNPQKYYHARLMSGQAFIDSLDFARNARELHGEMAVAGFARLQDALHANAGFVDFHLRGSLDDRRRPVLSVEVQGELQLQCQRCLGGVAMPLDLRRQLVLVSKPAELVDPAEEEDAVDTIPMEPQMDVAALVEDEILLALPVSPRHEDCAAPAATGEAEAPKQSPFAVLAERMRDKR
jgi:uncharacterized protein